MKRTLNVTGGSETGRQPEMGRVCGLVNQIRLNRREKDALRMEAKNSSEMEILFGRFHMRAVCEK